MDEFFVGCALDREERLSELRVRTYIYVYGILNGPRHEKKGVYHVYVHKINAVYERYLLPRDIFLFIFFLVFAPLPVLLCSQIYIHTPIRLYYLCT